MNRWNLRHGALALLTVFAAACDIPTSAPIVDNNWVVPIRGDSIVTDAFLPPTVSIVGTSYRSTLPVTTVIKTLGELCPQCVAPVFAVKPSFNFTITASAAVPSGVTAITLAAPLDVAISLTHDFAFDPIRPGAARGKILIVAVSATDTVSTLTIDGTATAWPQGQSLLRTLTIPAGKVLRGTINVTAFVVSPAGDAPTFIQPSKTLTIVAAPNDVFGSPVEITLLNRAVPPVSIPVDLGALTNTIRDKVNGGNATIALTNPAGVSGTLAVHFAGSVVDLIPSRTLTLSGGAADTTRITLTATEIRTLMADRLLRLNVTGTVSGTGAGNTAILRPGGVVRIAPNVVVAFRNGS